MPTFSYQDMYGDGPGPGEEVEVPTPIDPKTPGTVVKVVLGLLVVLFVANGQGWINVPFLPEFSDIPEQTAPVVAGGGGGDIECGRNVAIYGNSNPPKAESEGVKRTLWVFLRDRGLTNNQIAGVLGNIQAESGFRPGITELVPNVHGTRGYGLAQWTGNRRQALQNAANACKKPISDLAFQAFYLYKELNERPAGDTDGRYKGFKNEWDMVAHQGSARSALTAFHHEFEISHLWNGNPTSSDVAVNNARGGFADNILAEGVRLGW